MEEKNGSFNRPIFSNNHNNILTYCTNSILCTIRLYIAAISSGVKIRIFRDLVGMRLRRVQPSIIVDSMINATKAGLTMQMGMLEAHYLAGGNVKKVVAALISADKANIQLPFERAAAIDLAGRDVFEAVKMSVLPKVIETPLVAAVAKDGIQLKAIARVTVRANIDRLVGGAGEATVLARVGEGIVSTIGKKCLKIRIEFLKVYLQKGWIQEQLLKFFLLILPMLISDRTSAQCCRLIRQKQI